MASEAALQLDMLLGVRPSGGAVDAALGVAGPAAGSPAPPPSAAAAAPPAPAPTPKAANGKKNAKG
jgi:hypothetical protein